MVHEAIEHSWEVGDIRINGWIQENGDTAMVKATVTITEKNREADIINTFAKKDGEVGDMVLEERHHRTRQGLWLQ
jgi:aspartokinase-like uncharacterized kinase